MHLGSNRVAKNNGITTLKKTKYSKKRVKVDANRFAGVYKYKLLARFQGRPDVVYTITFKDPATGKKRWEKIGKKSEGITPELCSEIRSDRMKKIRLGEKVKTAKEIRLDKLNNDRPFGEVAEKYFEVKQDELKGYRTDFNRWENHLKPLFKKRRVSNMTAVDVQRVKSTLNGKAPATIWNTLELLRRITNWGFDHTLCPRLSFTIKMPKRDNEVVEYLTSEQAKKLDGVLAGWKSKSVARMLKVAMLTGMRRGEIFHLEDRDIEWKHHIIRLRDPKGGKKASIPLSNPVADILKEQIKWRDEVYPGSPFVFPGRGGRRRVDCSAAKRIKEKAGLPKKFRIFHGLRHHFAVTLANSGQVDLSLIGELLTHKSHAMTKRYASYLPKTTKAASELAVKLINRDLEKSKDTKTRKVPDSEK
jgi:integrase